MSGREEKENRMKVNPDQLFDKLLQSSGGIETDVWQGGG